MSKHSVIDNQQCQSCFHLFTTN